MTQETHFRLKDTNRLIGEGWKKDANRNNNRAKVAIMRKGEFMSKLIKKI